MSIEKPVEIPVKDTQDDCVNELIINAVKLRPELWDMRNKFYKNNEYKKVKWTEICYELNLEDAFVRTRWRSLRDRLMKEKKKAVPKSGQAANNKPIWYLMSSLDFLSGTVESRKTTTSIQRPSTTSSCSDSGAQSRHPKILAIGTEDETVPIDEEDHGNLSLADISHESSPKGGSDSSVDIEHLKSTTVSHQRPQPSGSRGAITRVQQNKHVSRNSSESRPTSAQSSSRTPKRARNSSPDPIEIAILDIVKSKEQCNTANKDTFTPEEHFYLSIARDVAEFKLTMRLKIRQAVLDAVMRTIDDNEYNITDGL